jgi:hypothetical protein
MAKYFMIDTNITQLPVTTRARSKQKSAKATFSYDVEITERRVKDLPCEVQPPKHYTDPLRKLWLELSQGIAFKEQDSPAFEMLVELVYRQRLFTTLTPGERAAMLKLFDAFKMTPKSRDKLDPAPGDKNEFDE